jgi:phosphohistidine phosphatase SixA
LFAKAIFGVLVCSKIMPMKTLMLLRHAKAGFDLSGQADAERVLTHAGKQDALKLGYKLKGRNDRVDHYLCSPATRTRQTLEAIREAIGEEGTLEIVPCIKHTNLQFWKSFRRQPIVTEI